MNILRKVVHQVGSVYKIIQGCAVNRTKNSAPCFFAVGPSEEMATLPVHEKHSAEEV